MYATSVEYPRLLGIEQRVGGESLFSKRLLVVKNFKD
jgi:hypothetical protein